MKNTKLILIFFLMLMSIMLLNTFNVIAIVGVVDNFNQPDGVISESSINNQGNNYFGLTSLSGCSYLNGEAHCISSSTYKNNISFVSGESVEFDIRCSTGYCAFFLGSNILEMDSGTTNWVINGGTTHTFIPSDYYHFKFDWNGTNAYVYVNDSLIENIPFNMVSDTYSFSQIDGGASLYLDNLEVTTQIPPTPPNPITFDGMVDANYSCGTIVTGYDGNAFQTLQNTYVSEPCYPTYSQESSLNGNLSLSFDAKLSDPSGDGQNYGMPGIISKDIGSIGTYGLVYLKPAHDNGLPIHQAVLMYEDYTFSPIELARINCTDFSLNSWYNYNIEILNTITPNTFNILFSVEELNGDLKCSGTYEFGSGYFGTSNFYNWAAKDGHGSGSPGYPIDNVVFTNNNYVPEVACTPSWSCNSTSCSPEHDIVCMSVVDSNNCGLEYSGPYSGIYDEFSFTGKCDPIYQCDGYLECANNEMLCTGVTDVAYTGILYTGDMSEFTQSCNSCTESWISQYTKCKFNEQIKSYVDVNNCGTINNIPQDNNTIIKCKSGGDVKVPVIQTTTTTKADNSFSILGSGTGMTVSEFFTKLWDWIIFWN